MTQATPDTLLKALKRALRPLVRLALAKGVGFPQLAELMKELYVDVAARDFPVPGKAQTDSRLSLLTGIHRKDIKRLRELPADDERLPETIGLGMRLVNAWNSAPFADAEGQPRPLARLASRGGELSFDALVASVSKDIRARAVLDEWVRLGVVTVDPEQNVILASDAFVPHQGFAEKAFYFGHNLHDHVAAAASNLAGDGPPFLERSVHYATVPADLVTALGKDAEAGGMRLLKALNRKVQQSPAADAGTPMQRFTFGVYFYAEPSANSAPAGDDAPRPQGTPND
jgi:hypothetical protein